MKFTAASNELMDIKEFEYSPHTLVEKKARYGKHLKPVIGDIEIGSLRYPVVQSILKTMTKNGSAVKSVAHVRFTAFVMSVSVGGLR